MVTPFLQDPDVTLWHGDVLDVLASMESDSVDCVVTSPPYWGLRSYLDDGHDDKHHELGLEPTPDQYVQRMVEVFREVRRVLAPHGTCWINLGSSYASGDTSSTRTRQPRHAPAYDSDGKAPADSPAPGSAYSDLCDECLDGFLNHHGRTSGTRRPHELDEPPLELTGRGSEPKGSASTSLAASLLDAPASTTLRSWLQQRAPCSRCASRAFSLSGVRSSASDAPASAHMSWLNYTSRLKAKDMVPTPWMVAMALQQDGWYLRSDVIWSKPNPMPESVTDRPTKSHEYVFLLTRQPKYFFDQEAVRERAEWSRWGDQTNGKHEGEQTSAGWIGSRTKEEIQAKARGGGFSRKYAEQQPAHGAMALERPADTGSRNVRSVWSIATQPYANAHFATFPEELVRRCILAGCREGGTVLDPFVGSGTTCKVARDHGRHSIGIDLNSAYLELAATRLQQLSLLTAEAGAVTTPERPSDAEAP